MPEGDKLSQFYSNLIATGKVSANEIGTIDQFKGLFNDSLRMNKFYDNLSTVFSQDEIGTKDLWNNSLATYPKGVAPIELPKTDEAPTRTMQELDSIAKQEPEQPFGTPTPKTNTDLKALALSSTLKNIPGGNIIAELHDLGNTITDWGKDAPKELLTFVVEGGNYLNRAYNYLIGKDNSTDTMLMWREQEAQRLQKELQVNREKTAKEQWGTGVGQFIGNIIPGAAELGAAIALKNPTIVNIALAHFGMTGFVDGGIFYDEYKAKTGEPVNPTERAATQGLFAMTMLLPYGKLSGKLMPKAANSIAGKITQEALIDNPEATIKTATELLEKTVSRNPAEVSQLLGKLAQGARHGGITGLEIELGRVLTKELIVGEHLPFQERAKELGQGIIGGSVFGGLLAPIAAFTQNKATWDRWKSYKQRYYTLDAKGNPIGIEGMETKSPIGYDQSGKKVKLTEEQISRAVPYKKVITFTSNEKGDPVEILPDGKGLTVDGRFVKVTPEMKNNSFVAPYEILEKSKAEYELNGYVEPKERDIYEFNGEQFVQKSVMDGTTNIRVLELNDGENVFFKRMSPDGRFIVMDTRGSEFPLDPAKVKNTRDIDANDFMEERMREWDNLNGYKADHDKQAMIDQKVSENRVKEEADQRINDQVSNFIHEDGKIYEAKLSNDELVYVVAGDPYEPTKENPVIIARLNPETGQIEKAYLNEPFSEITETTPEALADTYRQEAYQRLGVEMDQRKANDAVAVEATKGYDVLRQAQDNKIPVEVEGRRGFIIDTSNIGKSVTIMVTDPQSGESAPIIVPSERYSEIKPLSEEAIQQNEEVAAEIESQVNAQVPQQQQITATIGNKEVPLDYTEENGLITLSKAYTTSSEADKIVKALNNEYPNIVFGTVNTADPNNKLAKNNFIIREVAQQAPEAKQEEVVTPEQPQQDTEIIQSKEQEQQPQQQPGAEIQQPEQQPQENILPGKVAEPKQGDQILPEQAPTGEAQGVVEGGKEKEPWEMTREELKDVIKTTKSKIPFDKIQVNSLENILTAESNGYELNPKNAKISSTLWEQLVSAGVIIKNKDGKWQTSQDVRDYETATKNLIDHDYLIQQALSEGKPVPPEVIADYPELKAEIKPQEDLQIDYVDEDGKPLPKEVADELKKVDQKPTEKQKIVGNYQKGHVNIQGMDISIENPVGSVRSGKDEDGKAWEHTMKSHYGYFKNTEGKDGDHIDVFTANKVGVFMGDTDSQKVFVIDQVNPETGEFDESKVMLGYNTAEEAKAAYLENYDKNWKGFSAITEVNLDDFKKWLYDGKRQRIPFSEYEQIKQKELLKRIKEIKGTKDLRSSGELEGILSELKIDEKLKREIETYIKLNKATGYDRRFSNLTYRGNLHYIIENIDKPGLIDELKKLNKEVKNAKEIRSDQGQPDKTWVQPEGSQNKGSEGLQRNKKARGAKTGKQPQKEVKEKFAGKILEQPKKFTGRLSPIQKRAIDLDPNELHKYNAYDSALWYFITGGKINKDAIQSIFGGRNRMGKTFATEKERRARLSYYSPKGKNVDEIAHDLWMDKPESVNLETSEYRDAVEDVILSYNTPSSMSKAFIDKYKIDNNGGYTDEQLAEMAKIDEELKNEGLSIDKVDNLELKDAENNVPLSDEEISKADQIPERLLEIIESQGWTADNINEWNTFLLDDADVETIKQYLLNEKSKAEAAKGNEGAEVTEGKSPTMEGKAEPKQYEPDQEEITLPDKYKNQSPDKPKFPSDILNKPENKTDDWAKKQVEMLDGLSEESVRELDSYLAQSLSGDSNKKARQRIMSYLKGENVPVAKSGITAIKNEILKRLGGDVQFMTIPENKKQLNDWFKNSKIVDDNGKPLIVYHGTNRKFSVFRNDALLYFSPTPEYATMYTAGSSAKGAHYVSQKEKDLERETISGENIIPVYLSIQKPFDTRIPSIKKIFNEKYFMKYGNGTPLDEKTGLPDWTDADDIKDFIDENGYDYDGMIVADSHGEISYVAFRPNQVKSIFNRNYDEVQFMAATGEADQLSNNLIVIHNLNESNILESIKMKGLIAPSIAITNRNNLFKDFGDISLIAEKEIVNPEYGDVKVFQGDVYSPSTPRPYYHVDTKSLDKKADELVHKAYKKDMSLGTPVANIVSYFGGFYKDLNRMNPESVFSSHYEDMKIVYMLDKGVDFKVPYKEKDHYIGNTTFTLSKEQKEKLKPLISKFNKETEASSEYLTPETRDEIIDAFSNVLYDQIVNKYKDESDIVRSHFKDVYDKIIKNNIGERGQYVSHIAVDRFSEAVYGKKVIDEEKLKRIIRRKFTKDVTEDYSNWLMSFIDRYQGSRYFESGRNKLSYTAENLLNYQTGKTRAQEKMLTFGMNKAKAVAIKQFKNFDQVKKSRSKIVSKEEMTTIEKELQQKYFNISNKIQYKWSDSWGKLDAFGMSLADYYKGYSAESALRKNDYIPDKSDVEIFKEFAEELKNSPVDYFEAKMQRMVDIGEFKYAIVPSKTSSEVVRILKDKGLKVKKYSDDLSRIDIIKNLTDKDKQVQFISSKAKETPIAEDVTDTQIKVNGNWYAKSIINKSDFIEIGDVVPSLMREPVIYHNRRVYMNPKMVTSEQWKKLNQALTDIGFEKRPVNDWINYFDKLGATEIVNEDHIKAIGMVFKPSEPEVVDQKRIDKINKQAKKEAGLTNSFREAGYLMQDGSMLDYSGKRDGGMPGTRSYDHRQLPEDTDMVEFMSFGNIRMKPESNGFELTKKPTPQQISKLKGFMRVFDGVDGYGIMVDYSLPGQYNTIHTNEYPIGTRPERIINDIINFYDKGIRAVTPMVQFSAKRQPFYSPTERALSDITQEKATPEQWKAMLLKNGAKQTELDWMGWDERFGNINKTITKAEIQDWIDQNKVELKEVVKGASKWENNELIDNGETIANIEQNEDGTWSFMSDFSEGDQSFETKEEAKRAAEFATIGDVYSDNATKYSEYQTPGGQNYKEWLLTMPNKIKDQEVEDIINDLSDEYNITRKQAVDGLINGTYQVALSREQRNNLSGLANQKFTSSHFDEPNIVVHMRTNERTNADGKRVLFIEEIQSDWAEKGRKVGFDLSEAEKKARNYYPTNVVPDMPFKQTSQWVSLALRRMVRYAAENGFDKVAWTTGEQQAERYDLSKQISQINAINNGNNTYNLGIFDKGGNNISQRQNVNENDLSDFVGKELAEKIVSIPSGSSKQFTGLDLKVGGEGMKSFYDQIVPSTANKIFKKFGVKVGESEIDVPGGDGYGYRLMQDGYREWYIEMYDIESGDGVDIVGGEMFKTKKAAQQYMDKNVSIKPNNITIHSITLTPQLLEAATGGFPMFIKRSVNNGLSQEMNDLIDNLNWESETGNIMEVYNDNNEAVQAYLDSGGNQRTAEYMRKVDFGAARVEDTNQILAIKTDLDSAGRIFEVFIHEQLHAVTSGLGMDMKFGIGELVLASVPTEQYRKVVNDYKMYEKFQDYIKGDEYLAYMSGIMVKNGIVDLTDIYTDQELVKISERSFDLGTEFEELLTTDEIKKLINTFVYKTFLNESTRENTDLGKRRGSRVHAVPDRRGVRGNRPINERGRQDTGRSGSNGEDQRLQNKRQRIQELIDSFSLKKKETPRPKFPGEILSQPKRAIHQIETPQFKRWFGKSVVTVDGKPGSKPLVVYHGTGDDFSVFEKQFEHKGFFFSGSPKIASEYTESAPGIRMNVMPLYIKIENPLIRDFGGEVYNKWSVDYIINEAKSGDHDGVIIKNIRDIGGTDTQYVVFKNTQIKSATGNRGTFDPNNPDINFMVNDSFWKQRTNDKVISNPFEEGVPTNDKVNKIKEFISKNSDKYNPVYVKFYHGTGKGLPIEQEGLKPTTINRRRSYQSESGYVYLANTPDRAKMFGDLGNMSNSEIYEVIVPINDILADKDQLNNQRAAGVDVGNSIAESIVYGGGIRVKGKIEPWQIRKIEDQVQFMAKSTEDQRKAWADAMFNKKAEVPPEPPTPPKDIKELSDPNNPGLTTMLQSLIGKNKRESLYADFINRFAPIENAVREAIKSGAVMEDGSRADWRARGYLGIAGKLISTLNDQTFRINEEGAIENTGEGLRPILKDLEKEVPKIAEDDANDFWLYMEARRASADTRGVVVMPGGADPMEELKGLQDKYGDDFDKLDNIATRLYEFQKRVAHSLVDAGIMSEKGFRQMIENNPDYIPFQRVLDEDITGGAIPSVKNTFNKAGSPLKTIKGSELPIENPGESIIKNTYQILDRAERNRVALNIAKLSEFIPSRVQKLNQLFISTETGQLDIYEQPVKKIEKVANKFTYTDENGVKRAVELMPLSNKRGYVQYFDNGERKYMKVDENLYNAMTGLNDLGLGTIAKVLSKPANWLRTGVVITPEFWVRNTIRDQFTAFIQTSWNPRVLFDTAGAVADVLGKRPAYYEWLKSGGSYSAFVDINRDNLRKKFKELRKDPTLWSRLNVIRAAQDISGVFENATRIGIYKRSKLKGKSDVEAGFLSRESTIDFARRGRVMREINSMWAFFNPSLQGVDKFVRSVKSNPVSILLKALASITIPSLLLWLINKDDDEYNEMAPWLKDLFWNFKVGDTWVRIPKPYIYGQLFGSSIERFLDYIYKDDPYAVEQLTQSVIESASPVQGDIGGILLPTSLRPLIENSTNWSFFGERQLIPQGKQSLRPELQYGDYTTDAAKKLGKTLNYSPVKIENIVRGWGGTSGYDLLKLYDWLTKDPKPGRPLEPSDYYFIKGFTSRDPLSNPASRQKFYDLWNDLDKDYNSWNRLIKMGYIDEANEISSKYTSLPNIHVIMNEAKNKLKEYDDYIDNISESNMDDKTKKKQIESYEKLRLQIIKTANSSMISSKIK